jgi:diadenosine tetraphosphatase ApaH/serine/threonine PP2A family protein phosphatase
MPSFALLSDIHANDHALKAVLDEIAALGIEHIVVMGDIVGYAARPAECVDLVRKSGATAILGNHDEYTLIARRQPDFIPTGPASLTNPVWAGIRHAVKSLDQEAIGWLSSLPKVVRIPGAIVAHASLHDANQWPYLLSPRDARPTLELLDRHGLDLGFFGHTHRQEWFALDGKPEPETLSEGRFHITEGGVFAFVVGSVGQPRTGDNRAAWTVWDSDQRIVEFRRTAYPYTETVKDIHAAGLPASSARRLQGWS